MHGQLTGRTQAMGQTLWTQHTASKMQKMNFRTFILQLAYKANILDTKGNFSPLLQSKRSIFKSKKENEKIFLIE